LVRLDEPASPTSEIPSPPPPVKTNKTRLEPDKKPSPGGSE
jgi:hypothetical protein